MSIYALLYQILFWTKTKNLQKCSYLMNLDLLWGTKSAHGAIKEKGAIKKGLHSCLLGICFFGLFNETDNIPV